MIGIVILNYNTSDDCRKCISFLSNQVGVEVEIIVVDNYSRKDDIEKLSSFCSEQGITLLQSKENKGYSAGNNIGLRYAAEKGYEYAMIINPDIELMQPIYLKIMIDKLIVDTSIAVIGSDIINTDCSHINPLREITYLEELFWPIILIKKIVCQTTKQDVLDPNKSCYCEKLSGCCFMIKMDFLKDIGFLDEHTFLYCEEAILAKQISRSAYKMYYIAEIEALHNHIDSKKDNKNNRLQIGLSSRLYYLKAYCEYPAFAITLLKWSKLFHFKAKAIFHF